jgi:hypothetical protein
VVVLGGNAVSNERGTPVHVCNLLQGRVSNCDVPRQEAQQHFTTTGDAYMHFDSFVQPVRPTLQWTASQEGDCLSNQNSLTSLSSQDSLSSRTGQVILAIVSSKNSLAGLTRQVSLTSLTSQGSLTSLTSQERLTSLTSQLSLTSQISLTSWVS